MCRIIRSTHVRISGNNTGWRIWTNGPYSVSDIQNYVEYIFKRHETITDKSPVQIYVNKIQKRITFKMKTEYCLELWNYSDTQNYDTTRKYYNKDNQRQNW